MAVTGVNAAVAATLVRRFYRTKDARDMDIGWMNFVWWVYGRGRWKLTVCTNVTVAIFCWAVVTQHHGFDWSGRLDWINCEGVVEYPACNRTHT